MMVVGVVVLVVLLVILVVVEDKPAWCFPMNNDVVTNEL
jgi:hypothetical protein